MKLDPRSNHRILLIDDNKNIHDDFRKILTAPSISDGLSKSEGALFGKRAEISKMPIFEIDSAYNGEDGLALIQNSLLKHRPYAFGLYRCSDAAWMGRDRNDMQDLGKVFRPTSCHMHSLFRLFLERDGRQHGTFRSDGHLEKAF